MKNADLANVPTDALVSALWERKDVLAVKVWTRDDCEGIAREYMESEHSDLPEAEADRRVDAIVDSMMGRGLDVLCDCTDAEWDALYGLAADCDA